MRFIKRVVGPAPLVEQRGEDINLPLLTRANLTISLRVVPCENDSEVILWGQPCWVIPCGLLLSRVDPIMRTWRTADDEST